MPYSDVRDSKEGGIMIIQGSQRLPRATLPASLLLLGPLLQFLRRRALPGAHRLRIREKSVSYRHAKLWLQTPRQFKQPRQPTLKPVHAGTSARADGRAGHAGVCWPIGNPWTTGASRANREFRRRPFLANREFRKGPSRASREHSIRTIRTALCRHKQILLRHSLLARPPIPGARQTLMARRRDTLPSRG